MMTAYEQYLKLMPSALLRDGKPGYLQQVTVEAVRNAMPIIFTGLTGTQFVEPITKETVHKINLPFDSCFYEIDKGAMFGFDDADGTEIAILGLFITQFTPSQFKASLLASTKGRSFILSPEAIDPVIMNHILGTVYILTERFHSEHKGMASPRTSVKTRNTDGSKHFHRINKVVYVSGKKSAASFGMEEREIDWSHRWEVRGHWRRIEGLGRDRHDQQIVKGYTWVKNYVKGDPSLPLVKKVRFVQ
jgi:hypothetical protein